MNIDKSLKRYLPLKAVLVFLMIALLFIHAGTIEIVRAATIVVDATVDEINSGNGECTLREAINNANAGTTDTTGGDCVTGVSGADTISLPAGTYTLAIPGTGENSNATGDLDITEDLIINGEGARTTIINANDIDRVFDLGATVTFNDVTIQGGDVSGTGGGINIASTGNFTLNGVYLYDNVASTNGGAIYKNSTGTSTINTSAVSMNDAATDGGGIYAADGTLTVNNSTIGGNTADVNGGGVAASGAGVTINLNHATVTANTADNDNNASGADGGLHQASSATLNIQNTIVSGNTTLGTGADDCGGTITTGGYNLYGSGGSVNGCSFTPATGDATITGATSTVIDTTFQNNGEETNTYALYIHPVTPSPAIDAIPSATSGCNTTYTDDQRGVDRPLDGDADGIAACDIGAFEFFEFYHGTGPGGIGETDGTSTLELWLRGDKDTYQNAGCSTKSANGNDVLCWVDQSGNGHDATVATASAYPSLTTNSINGQPVLNFDGNDFMQSDNVPLGDFAFFTVFNASTDGFLYEHTTNANTTNGSYLYTGTGCSTYVNRSSVGSGKNNTNSTWGTSGTIIALQEFGGTNATHTMRVNETAQSFSGTPCGSFSDPGSAVITDTVYIGSRAGTGVFLTGNIAEIIFFDDTLVALKRILVSNYLSAKYNLSLSANDHFDGDTSGNGNFDFDVAGIGKDSSGTNTEAHSAGLIVRDRTFLLDNDDWLLIGHSGSASRTSSDLPASGDGWGGGDDERWLRTWYIDVTDNTSGTDCGTTTCYADLIFDQSEGQMDNDPTDSFDAPAASYRLLKRSGTSGAFSDITFTCTDGAYLNGDDQILFLNVDVACLGSNFTLGSTNRAASPTAIELDEFGSSQGLIGWGSLVGLLVFIGFLFWSRSNTQRLARGR